MIHEIAMFLITTAIGALFALIAKVFIDLKAQREATLCLLRTEMTKFYYRYRDEKKMPYYIKEAWYLSYEKYTKLNGNTFIQDIKREIDAWEVE